MTKPFKLSAPVALERQEQQALFQWAAVEAQRDPRLALLFAIPNGTSASSVIAAVNAKRTGLKRGVPDMFLPVASRGWHGLFIEMKRRAKRGRLSEEQHEWLGRLLEQDYQVVVCEGWESASACIREYLQRGGAVAARQAHNLEVAGSSPAPATNMAEVAQ